MGITDPLSLAATTGPTQVTPDCAEHSEPESFSGVPEQRAKTHLF